jgi:hypothetical protein
LNLSTLPLNQRIRSINASAASTHSHHQSSASSTYPQHQRIRSIKHPQHQRIRSINAFAASSIRSINASAIIQRIHGIKIIKHHGSPYQGLDYSDLTR